ncbi:hypothetical protein Q8A73_015623 [Channa argus]|nr:hypothetical protein Q8A73_015623 [Channa argus]
MGSMNSINPQSTEEVVAEGRNINLTCKYEGAIYSIQWYRQYQRSRPEFLLYITETGSINPPDSDFSAHIDKTETLIRFRAFEKTFSPRSCRPPLCNATGVSLLHFEQVQDINLPCD